MKDIIQKYILSLKSVFFSKRNNFCPTNLFDKKNRTCRYETILISGDWSRTRANSSTISRWLLWNAKTFFAAKICRTGKCSVCGRSYTAKNTAFYFFYERFFCCISSWWRKKIEEFLVYLCLILSELPFSSL